MVELEDPSIDLEIPGVEESIKLIGLRYFMDRLEVEFSEMAALFKQSKYWDYEGFNTAGNWMRFNCHMTSTAAADRINVGEHLADMKESRAAMDEGEIGFAHVTVMARTADAVGKAFDETSCFRLPRRALQASSTTSACTTDTPSMPRPMRTSRPRRRRVAGSG